MAEGFLFGDDVVLLTMDGDGVTALMDAVKKAVREGSSRLFDGVVHVFVVEAGAAHVQLGGDGITWRFDRVKADEVIEHLSALNNLDRPGHSYVDISEPVDTLVLSRDEYVG
ncbi:hypothetical protein EU78_04600 [Mycolicibacterium rufum]|nr:hypothetical protein EU78_04600 [Mycolicibacterium rufum]